MKKLYIALTLLAITTMMLSCAKQGFPSGGPKDETPPVVIGTTPPNGTLHFDAKEFVILFDEYVTMKDLSGVLVSPTMNKKAEFGTRGHGLVVKIKDTLQPSTTYLFQFKNAIADFNEGNLLPSFEYVFSTGSSIDSMTLRGQVLDAFSQKPCSENVSVVAFAESQMSDSIGDSIVAKVQPMYMTRPDKEGRFELNHLREGRYLLIAIEDGDKNMRLGKDEAVAFLDSLVTAVKMPPPPDTTKADSTAVDSTQNLQPQQEPSAGMKEDSSAVAQGKIPLSKDTSDSTAVVDTLTPSLKLLLSQNKKDPQRISKSTFSVAGKIEIVTAVPLSKHYTLHHIPADTASPTELLWHHRNDKGDTLHVWLANKECDSLRLLLHDTTGLHDTLKLKRTAATNRTPKTGKSSLPRGATSTPSIMKSRVAAQHPYFDTLWLAFLNPIAGISPNWQMKDSSANPLDSAVTVLALKDSTITHCGIRLMPDSTLAPAVGMKAYLLFDGKAGEKYQFTVPAGLFHDIWHNTSDSISIKTEYTKTESYGNIALTLLADSTSTKAFPRLIVQITNEKGDMIQQQVVDKAGKYSFLHLKGGKYGVRAIVDSDGNGVWTPGDWWQHRQPEQVLLFPKTLELRENWDMEEKWTIKN